VKHDQGAERARVYSGVWATLLDLESLDPASTRPPLSWEDDDDAWLRHAPIGSEFPEVRP
jgi:hypothetical protein